MLGVLKRRWKPKRSGSTRIVGADSALVDGAVICEKTPPRLANASTRQVHPLCEDKVHPLCGDLPDSSPPPYPKRASLDTGNYHHQQQHNGSDSPPQCYPLAPNICVESGRIQFVRQATEVASDAELEQQGVAAVSRVTVTRGQQTDFEEADDVLQWEIEKELLQNQISELEISLQQAQKNEQKDKHTLAKLQKQLARRESAHRDADRERRLRMDSESRAKQAIQEATRIRSRLKLLTTEFSRMEETVRSMLVYKKQVEQLRQEKAALTLAFENRSQQYQNTISRLNQEIALLKQKLEQTNAESNPELVLEAHTAALQRQANESRKQYERCLDDVASQVVKALLAQKSLRGEVSNLNGRIQELESQNRALTSMLVHQLREDSSEERDTDDKQLALEDSNSLGSSPTNVQTSLNIKHCNSFNSEILETSPCEKCDIYSYSDSNDKNSNSNLESRFSLEDKKRHQVLTKLWTDLKGSEVTPKKLLEALSLVDSSLWVPPKRPVSLNLHLPVVQTSKFRKATLILAKSSSKSEEDTNGNESPESGNRDEGYSTMSSDVQTDTTRVSGAEAATNRELEDLKEASDETDLSDSRLFVSDKRDPDVVYIPLNLLNLQSRNSYPPGRNMIPFQHIMRSFSDSHLCIKITTSPSPYYTFSSPISSSPSIFLVDFSDRLRNPLRRTRATSTLWGNANIEICEDNLINRQLQWRGSIEDRMECQPWDTEYIQQWLRLDETRISLQQQNKELFELEYDKTELEDWSLSLSNEDLRDSWKKLDAATPSQFSISTLPSIQENNALELEEDSNECLWNDSSYMVDKEGRELVTLLMDTRHEQVEKSWPYAQENPCMQASPNNSWSSGGSDCCHSFEPETCSKRSSAALSGCSDDTGELPAVGTDFTRDFYRLVKFESTKSLASTSSRSIGGGALSDNGERETALQNVLTFIAEQQKYVCSKDNNKEFHHSAKETKNEDSPIKKEKEENDVDLKLPKINTQNFEDENYVTLKQLCHEYTLNEQNLKEHQNTPDLLSNITQNISYAHEICLVTPLDVESENCLNISEQPVDICTSVNVEVSSSDYQSSLAKDGFEKKINETSENDLTISSNTTFSDNNGSESLTSSVSTPETIVSKIPRRKLTPSRLPSSPSKIIASNQDTKIPKSKIPHKKLSKNKIENAQKHKLIHVQQKLSPKHLITSEKLPQSKSGVISTIIDGPPHRAVSFHERATSKDVIDELNRMIKNGDETTVVQEQVESIVNARLDQSCKPTGWIHVEKDIDLTDPKARANLLDVMMASVSSDSSPTSSCGGSVASDTTEDPPDYGHLHRIHRFHRQKKAKAVRPEMAVVRASQPVARPTIIGRPDFYVRYGEKEREAVASFDFLDELSSTTSGGGTLSYSIDESDEVNSKNSSDCCVVRYHVTQV